MISPDVAGALEFGAFMATVLTALVHIALTDRDS